MADLLGNEKSRSIVALPDAKARKEVRKLIQEAGFAHCREVPDIATLTEKLGSGDIDLLVTTLGDRNWDSGQLIRAIRQGKLGNPFMIIMVLVDQPTPDLVSRVVNAGADDLLLSSWPDKTVLGRLEGLVHNRKRFLVTHDYVGPERRNTPRPGVTSANTFEVPNPLHWFTIPNNDRDGLNRAVEQASEVVNRNKIKSCGNQLRFLADRAVAGFAAGGHAAIIPDMQVMLAAANELCDRAANTEFAQAIELSAGLRTLCQRLVREDRPARAAEVGVLPQLADAVIKVIHDSEPEPIPESHLFEVPE